MHPQNEKHVREVFQRVLEAAPQDRQRVLAEAAADQPDLIERVQQLLGAFERAGDFLAEPTLDGTVAYDAQAASASLLKERESVAGSIGPYQLLEKIGEGGFGLVFLAEQHQPVRRKVALKVIKLGMDSRQVIARFEAERQALAIMDHPNIARVIDGGTTQTGQPYFVMELVQGTPITDYCDENHLSISERLGLFAQVCRAVQHAHQKGIIHRDLKPSNVLVTLSDGRATPKVIDFGIAKAIDQRLTEKTIFTDLHHMIGTPQYMSPEQADGNGTDVDTRTDVFSLGVLLYELLVGATPFDPRELRSKAYGEMQRIIRDVEPPRPSTRLSALDDTVASIAACRKVEPKRLGQIMKGELDWIVMKAMEKDRTRRYETAESFAADVQRYLNREAVLAGPATASYRVGKFVRRHKVMLAMTTAIVVALVGGLVAATIGLMQAHRGFLAAEKSLIKEKEQRGIAETASQLAEQRRLAAVQSEANYRQAANEAGETVRLLQDMLTAADPDKSKGQRVTVREVMDAAVKTMDDNPGSRLPYIESVARRTVGLTYKSLGMWTEAEKQFRIALRLRRAIATKTKTTDLAESLNDLAGVLEEGNHADSGNGREPQRADLSEVLPLLTEALAAYRELSGNDNLNVAVGLNNLGLALLHNDRLAAEAHFREALAIYQKLDTGDGTFDSTKFAAIQLNLGVLADVKGQPDEAEKLYRQALKNYREKLGDDNTIVNQVRRNLALALEKQGDVDEALGELQMALASDRKILSELHPFLADDCQDLGWVLLKDKKDAVAALPLLREAVKIRRAVLPPGHDNLIHSLVDLGRALQQEKIDDEALKCYAEALNFLRASLDDHEPLTVAIRYFQAEILVRQNHFPEAEKLLLKTYADMESGKYNTIGFHNDAVGRIVDLYEKWRKTDQAREWKSKLRAVDNPAQH